MCSFGTLKVPYYLRKKCSREREKEREREREREREKEKKRI